MGLFSNPFRRVSDTLKDLVQRRGYFSLDNNSAELEGLKQLLVRTGDFSLSDGGLEILSAIMSEASGSKIYIALMAISTKARFPGQTKTKTAVSNKFYIMVVKQNSLKSAFFIRSRMPPIVESMTGSFIDQGIQSKGGRRIDETLLPEFQKYFVAYAMKGADVELPKDIQYILVNNIKNYPFKNKSASSNIMMDSSGLYLNCGITTSTEALMKAVAIAQELLAGSV